MAQIVIVVDREILRHFKAECIRRETTATKAVNALIEQQVRAWIQEGLGVPACLEPAAKEVSHA